jgi:hypothetical protein
MTTPPNWTTEEPAINHSKPPHYLLVYPQPAPTHVRLVIALEASNKAAKELKHL